MDTNKMAVTPVTGKRRGATVGMGQIVVEGGAPEANLARAVAVISEAGDAGCDIVVLPECLDLGWTHPSARTHAQPIPGPYADRLRRAAAESGIYVAAGLTENDRGAVYNTAVLIDNRGTIVLKHRKINILDIARDLYTPGGGLGVANTPFGTIGMLVCADNFPETRCLGDSLATMGATMILSPCAWAVPPDHDNQAEPYGDLWRGSYGALARSHDLVIVGVSNVGPIAGGPWEGRHCIGCSLAVGPGGEVLAQAPYGLDAETLLVFQIPVTGSTPAIEIDLPLH